MLGLFIVMTLVEQRLLFYHIQQKGAIWLQHLLGMPGASIEYNATAKSNETFFSKLAHFWHERPWTIRNVSKKV